MNQTTILIAATLAVGIGGGYIIGRNTHVGDAVHSQQSATPQLEPRMQAGQSNSRMSSRPANRGRDYSGYDKINRLPGSGNRIHALMEYYQGLAPAEFEQAAKKIEDLPMGDRAIAGLLLYSRWGEVDGRSAMDHCANNSVGSVGSIVKSTVFQSWAGADPVRAAEYDKEHGRSLSFIGGSSFNLNSGGGTYMIGSEWAKTDPEGAIAWATGLNPMNRQTAVAAVIAELAREDPQKAARMFGSIDPQAAGASYGPLAEHYGAKDFAAAQSWISSLPPDRQDSAMAQAIKGLASTDTKAAAAQVLAMEEGNPKDWAICDVVEAMAAENPAKAAEFLAVNGSPVAQETGMSGLISVWASKNPKEALTHVMGMDPGDARDRAINSYFSVNRSAPAADLVRLAENLSADHLRTHMLRAFIMRWMQEDKEAAKAYIESTDAISDRTREYLK